MDLPQRRCSFSTSTYAANALTAAGSSAPSCLVYSAPPALSIAVPRTIRGDRGSEKNLVLRHLRAATTARVSFYAVTIECHDRYSAQMTPPHIAGGELRGIANTSSLM